MFLWIVPAAIAGASLLGGVLTNRSNAKEARRNREFQERMSSTAHQREVADLRAAGVNPMLRNMGGASTPGGDRAEMEDAVGKGVSSGLQAKMMKAQIGLVEDQALLTRTQAGAIQQEWNAGKFERLVSERELAALSVQEKRQMMPVALERAKAEVGQISSSARAARARAVLDEAARTGALNAEQFEKLIGEAGPATRFFLELIRGLRSRQ